MTTVYMLKKGAKAKKEGQRITIEFKDKKIQSVPLKSVASLVAGEGTHISTPLLELMMEREIPVYFIDFFGHVKGEVCSSRLSWKRSKTQMEKFMHKEEQLKMACWLVIEKMENQRKLLKYYARNLRDLEIGQYASDIGQYVKELDKVEEIDIIRGIEGIAAKMYFSAYDIILEGSGWPWKGRSRRPAQDAANALLNYTYAFLEREVRVAIVGAGLDPRFGFLHSNNDRKESLVFDLMELFRQPVIDRFVLSVINHHQLEVGEFDHDDIAGWRVGEDAKRKLIPLYENYMERVYQEYDGMTPREWIRKRVKDFALYVFKEKIDEVVAA